METIFFISISVILYTYFFYPAFVILISKTKTVQKHSIDELPTVTIIIPVFNEEQVIEKKIDNCLKLNYPKEKVEIFIGSDGSKDSTPNKLEATNIPGITSFIFNERHGKSWVINQIAGKSRNDILIFTDANTMLDPNAVYNLVQYYDDETIGGVCGNLRLISDKNNIKSGEQAYWSFENTLKKAESRIKTVFGASGGLYSVRRKLFSELPTSIKISDDFLIPIFVLMQGSRVVFADDALATETTVNNIFMETKRRIRIAPGNFNGIRFYKSILKPTNGFAALGLFSHKILRWAAPLFFLGILVSTFLLSNNLFYKYFLYLEIFFIISSILGLILNILNIQIKFLSYCAHFFMLNVGLAIGFIKFLFVQPKAYWDTENRP